jgi:protein SMG6
MVYNSPAKPSLKPIHMCCRPLRIASRNVIQLDDFPGTLAHFLKRLEMEGKGVEEYEWVMMGIVNLSAVLEYGGASSAFRGVKDGTNVSGGSSVKAMV